MTLLDFDSKIIEKTIYQYQLHTYCLILPENLSTISSFLQIVSRLWGVSSETAKDI